MHFALKADASRLRLVLEGGRRGRLNRNRAFVPALAFARGRAGAKYYGCRGERLTTRTPLLFHHPTPDRRLRSENARAIVAGARDVREPLPPGPARPHGGTP